MQTFFFYVCEAQMACSIRMGALYYSSFGNFGEEMIQLLCSRRFNAEEWKRVLALRTTNLEKKLI